MDFVRIYYDIVKEIEIYECRLKDLEGELKANQDTVFTGESPSGSHVPLDRALTDYIKVQNEYIDLRERLAEKKVYKRQIEDSIREFEGIEYKVAYMRDIEIKSLDQIAEETGFSYSYISKISSKIPKIKVPR